VSRSDHLVYLELFLGRPQFNSSATFVKSQLVCLLPVGILNHVICSFALFVSSFVSIGPEKPYWGSGQVHLNLFEFFFLNCPHLHDYTEELLIRLGSNHLLISAMKWRTWEND